MSGRLIEQGSTMAAEVDALWWFLVVITGTVCALVAGAVVLFAVRYRRRRDAEVGYPITGSIPLELAWTVLPLLMFMVFFFWGASIFFRLQRPPANATEVYIIGRQWMWKAQHLGGQREINELHVPLGRPMKLIMSSEDVIHSFYVPAFRQKMDVIPGRYTVAWFQATRAGTYDLFCAEYCGTRHSKMVGKVIVMEPSAFQRWLSGGPQDSLADVGARLFQSLGCMTCHRPDAQARGPRLEGLFGKTVALQDGREARADESYIRESIVLPQAKLVAGFQPIMPTFAGQVTEEQLLALVEYVKSLAGEREQTPKPEPEPEGGK